MLITKRDDWYELEAYGPIQRFVIICSNLRVALEKAVETLDRQCDEYQLEQKAPEWWDAEEEDFSASKTSRH